MSTISVNEKKIEKKYIAVDLLRQGDFHKIRIVNPSLKLSEELILLYFFILKLDFPLIKIN